MKLTDLDILMCRSRLESNGILNPSNSELAYEFIRNHRNGLLENSDWMAGSDVTMSDAWKKYRKDLRDLPANSTASLDENNELTGVTWPTQP